MSFLTELKRRNVYRVAAAYGIVGWMLVQVTSVFVPALKLPEWSVTLVAFVVVIGFPIALTVSWVYELTPEGLKRTADVPTEQSIAHVTAQKLNYAIIGALAVALVFVVVDAYVLRGATVAPTNATATAAPTAAPATAATASQVLPNSVAVLPFANMSPNADDAYFAQGVHEEVLNQLAKIGTLSVIARTSVLRYADNKMSIPEIARELNVQTVMEGSVRYAGDSVRITAQLIDPKTGAHLWSEAYQRKIDDIFEIQADIAMNIANALRAEFSLEEQQAIERPPTSSPEAYALYLQARALPFGAMESAHELLDRAIALDPSFAAAYGSKARLYAGMLTNNAFTNAVRLEERADVVRRLRDNADRALALDPRQPAALSAVGAIDVQSWRWSSAPLLEPEDLSTLYSPPAVWVHAWMGNVAQILPVSERWAEIDPNVVAPHVNLGVLYAYAGNREASSRAFQRALEISPVATLARAFLAFNAAATGNADVAFSELQRLEQLVGDNVPIVFLPEIAYTYARIGRGDDARRLFARIEAASKERDIGTGAWALGYLAIGDEEHALQQLETAAAKARDHEADASYLNLMNLRMNFLADPRIETPRFAAVLARIRGD